MIWWVFLVPLLLSSCKGEDEKAVSSVRAEPVVRKSSQIEFALKAPVQKRRAAYPWEHKLSGKHTKITKEHFRCKGSFASPIRTVVGKNGETARYFDCGGVDRHSLYVKEGKEFIYPVLLDLLNYIQTKSGHKVIVTSGYRCPDHNTYVDPSPQNAASKHMIGAAVTFYVQGLEADKVMPLITKFYQERYPDQKEFIEFERYNKSDTDVTTAPWKNKELFIKLYKPGEGRNPDNSHPFAYLALQVRYDLAREQKVVFTWDEAFRSYLRK